MAQKKTNKKVVLIRLRTNRKPAGKDSAPRFSREQALAEGAQVEVTEMAVEAGLRWPVYLTRSVYDAYVVVPPNIKHPQDEKGRLWDNLWMARHAIVSKKGGQSRQYALRVRTNRGRRVVNLVVSKSVLDLDNPQPVLVIMLPAECDRLQNLVEEK